MKISKLFHWLYALIMFLPVFFWIPTAFYYGFNEHAINPSTTDVQINYKYQSNEVNSVDDIVLGNIYLFEGEVFWEYQDEYQYSINIYSAGNFSFNYDDYQIDEVYIADYSVDTSQYINLYINDYQNMLLTSNGNGYTIISNDDVWSFYMYDVIFSVEDGLEDFKYTLSHDYNILPVYTDFNVIESIDVVETEGISSAMNKSWQDVWSLPMFSWTHDTFFSAPFNYIAGLFGIQAGNTLSYCLSYWFSISIIWLVFDLMLYVPLLVHRWLDKAGIQ